MSSIENGLINITEHQKSFSVAEAVRPVGVSLVVLSSFQKVAGLSSARSSPRAACHPRPVTRDLLLNRTIIFVARKIADMLKITLREGVKDRVEGVCMQGAEGPPFCPLHRHCARFAARVLDSPPLCSLRRRCARLGCRCAPAEVLRISALPRLGGACEPRPVNLGI